MMASLHLLPPLSKYCSSLAPLPASHSQRIFSLPSLSFTARTSPFISKSFVVRFALTESDSPKSLEPDPRLLLQEIADSFELPPDYFAQLPRDLRLDLNDASFDLSNGPIVDESFKNAAAHLSYIHSRSTHGDPDCGQELGEILLNLSRAWELADASTCHSLVSKLPLLVDTLTGKAKSALGKRLLSAGRRFQSMGKYGQGEPEKIARAMITAGRVLSDTSTSAITDEPPKEEARMLKFGELQVELTPDKANIGAVIGIVFGVLSWEIAQGIQSIPESSLQYANENALVLAKSLRGTLLALFYLSTLLSAFTSVGLVLLGIQLKSKKD